MGMGMGLWLGAPERRNGKRGSPHGEPARVDLVNRILETYWEMPGLKLTLAQATRLFGLRARTCEVVLSDLVRASILHRAEDGTYQLPGQ